jgi:O-methyltransferase domain/Dimerisation domain
MAESDGAPAPSPTDVLLQVMTSYVLPQALYVVTSLGVATHLVDGPKEVTELARLTGAHPRSLARLLRALVSAGVFVESDGAFGQTALSRCLLPGEPGSVRASVMVAGAQHYRAWGDLLYSVKTGEPAFDHVFGSPCYDYMAANPEAAADFDASMRETGDQQWTQVAAAYDFSRFGTLVDVGGGHGALLAAILQNHPALHGVLFDLPGVVAGAHSYLESLGVASRCTIVAGSFFEGVPSGGDCYLLARTLLNWEVERAQLILEQCRTAVRTGGRLVVAEPLLPPAGVSFADAFNDLNLLVLGGGQMCTEAEIGALLQGAGFRLTAVHTTPTRLSLIEASPA